MKRGDLKEMENSFSRQNFSDVISRGAMLLKKVEGEKEKRKILKMIGLSFDQFALEFSGKKQKAMQEKALLFLRELLKQDALAGLKGIALVKHHQGKLVEASTLYKRCLNLCKNKECRASVFNDLGNVHRALWMDRKRKRDLYFRKSVYFYNKSIQLAPKRLHSVSPLINLSILNQKTGRHRSARIYAIKALKIVTAEKKSGFLHTWEPTLRNIIDRK